MALNDRLDAGRRGLNNGQQSQRLMVRNKTVMQRLDREAGHQIALAAQHHSNPTHHIVDHLAPASVDPGIHRGEVVLRADHLHDHARESHEELQPLAVFIRLGIVGMHKDPALKVQSVAYAASPDNIGCIPREAPFRPDLRPVHAPLVDMDGGLHRRGFRCPRQPGTPFLSCQAPGPLKDLDEPQHILAVGGGEVFKIVEEHLIPGRVMLAREEPGVLRNGKAALAQQHPHRRLVPHSSEDPGVGSPGTPATGPAVQRGGIGVIIRRAPMPTEKHKPGEGPGEAHEPKGGLDDCGLLSQRKALRGDPEGGSPLRRLQARFTLPLARLLNRDAGGDRLPQPSVELLPEPGIRPPGERLAYQRQAEQPAQEIHRQIRSKRAVFEVMHHVMHHLMPPGAGEVVPQGPIVIRARNLSSRILRFDNHRAEQLGVSPVKRGKGEQDTKEAGKAQCFIRPLGLQMSAEHL